MRMTFLNTINVLIQLYEWNAYYVVIMLQGKFLQDPSLCVGTHLSESSLNVSKVDRAKDISRKYLNVSISTTWQLYCELGVPLYLYEQGCPTRSPRATCHPGWLWMLPNTKSYIYFKAFFFFFLLIRFH